MSETFAGQIPATELAVVEHDAVPLLDMYHMSMFDEQYTRLLELAIDKGFTERISTIHGQRRRMYAERNAIWKQLTIYGEPFAALEQQETDEESRSWLLEKLSTEMENDALAYTSQRANSFYNRWQRSNGLGINNDKELLSRADSEYRIWYEIKAETVISELGEFLNKPNLSTARTDLRLMSEHASRQFYNHAFEKFDNLFETRLQEGIKQLETMTPFEKEVTGRGYRLLRFLGRRSMDADAVSDKKAAEYDALSAFFQIAPEMTKLLQSVGDGTELHRIVGDFKRNAGLTALESYARQMVHERIDGLINKASTNQFFERYEDELDRKAQSRSRRTSSSQNYSFNRDWDKTAFSTEEPAADEVSEDIPWSPEAMPAPEVNHVTALHGVASSRITFDKMATESPDMLAAVVDHVAEGFKAQRLNQGVDVYTAEVIGYMCRDFLENADPTDDDVMTRKHAVRRILSNYHTDTLGIAMSAADDEKSKETRLTKDKALAGAAGLLTQLWKEDKLILKLDGQRGMITIRK